jgi:hypothetical protein
VGVLKDITGQRFGRLTMLERLGYVTGTSLYRARCDCGVVRVVRACNVRNGTTKSCGCLSRGAIGPRSTTHGATRGAAPSPEYVSWSGMIRRCENPRATNYEWYGARGISVCPRWRESFAAFLADVGPRPSRRHSLDRIDPSGNYEPGNVRWSTHTEQMRNRRDTWTTDWEGRRVSVREVCERTGLRYQTVWDRVRKHGWSLERALATRHDARRRQPSAA